MSERLQEIMDGILAERVRQVEAEGFDAAHDSQHDKGELAWAAVHYAAPSPVFVHEKRRIQLNSSRGISDAYVYDYAERLDYYEVWPFDEEPKPHPRIRQLEIAAALILAEIERLTPDLPQK